MAVHRLLLLVLSIIRVTAKCNSSPLLNPPILSICLYFAVDGTNPMTARNFPASFWDSNYVPPAPAHPQVSERIRNDNRHLHYVRFSMELLINPFVSPFTDVGLVFGGR